METQANQTQMVAPPDVTKMVDLPKTNPEQDKNSEEKVTLKFVRDLDFGGASYRSGNEYSVPKSVAKQILALKKDKGGYDFSGERVNSQATRAVLTYAELVRKPDDLI